MMDLPGENNGLSGPGWMASPWNWGEHSRSENSLVCSVTVNSRSEISQF